MANSAEFSMMCWIDQPLLVFRWSLLPISRLDVDV